MADPILQTCWGEYAIDFNEDDPPYDYLVAALISRRISFFVSTDAAPSVLAELKALMKEQNISEDDQYLSVMHERALLALSEPDVASIQND